MGSSIDQHHSRKHSLSSAPQQHPSANPSADLPIDLSIIIVSWNVWPLLRDALQSIALLSTAPETSDARQSDIREPEKYRTFGPAAQYRLEVIVVDSNSSDETVTALPEAFPWVRLLCSDRNLGFTRGNNWGYRVSRGNYLFFLNPDTSLTAALESVPEHDRSNDTQQVNPLTILYETIVDDPTIGMIGPQLRYGDGSWQNSRRRFPTRFSGFFESTWLGQFWPQNRWIRHIHMLDHPSATQHDVEWLNGSAMLCRRQALESIRTDGPGNNPGNDHGNDNGPFDEQFFMYSEELDLCRRMVQAGWRIVYEPRVTILHYEGRSSEQVVTNRHITFNTSKVRYYRKYFGSAWATILRYYLLFEYLIQIVMESAKWLLRHKPALRRSRIAAYLAILRNGLQTYPQA